MNREIATDDDLSDWAMVWQSIVGSGHTVHESICSAGVHTYHLFELVKNKNYNITLSGNYITDDWLFNELKKVKDQVQISIYSSPQMLRFKEWQKLFLIKDEHTYNWFKGWLGEDTGQLHFLLDQNWLTTDTLKEIIPLFNSKASVGQSIDSCLTSWLVNGRCPYSDGKYIDINFDGTVRTCPYADKGVLPKRGGSLNTLFGLKMLPRTCIYTELFGETNNGRINNTCLQNYITNNRSRSSCECFG
jgi:hypothetical protein